MSSKLLKKIILVNLLVIVSVVAVIIIKSSVSSKEAVKTNTAIVTEINPTDVQNNPQTTGASLGAATQASDTPASPSAAAVPDTRCIVTVSGNRYDVTSYRKKHPGGDIFTCGTDMTSIFISQHGSGTLNKMTAYLVK